MYPMAAKFSGKENVTFLLQNGYTRTQGTVAVPPGGASPTPPRRKPPGT